MSKYAVVFEPTRTGYSAYIPDLPGCIATGKTLHEAQDRIQSAMEMHLRAMREDGHEIPEPSHVVEMLEVA